MANGSFELIGVDSFLANLQRLASGANELVAGPTKDEADAIMRESKERYVPFDEGDLQKSGYVGGPVKSGDVVSVEMGFTAPYAVVQHENLNFNHPGGKSAKYLEIPFMAAEHGMAERMAPKVGANVEKLVK